MNTRSARSASRTQQPTAQPEKAQQKVPEETKVLTKNPKKRKIEETTSSISNQDAKAPNPKNSAKRRKPNPNIAKKKPTKASKKYDSEGSESEEESEFSIDQHEESDDASSDFSSEEESESMEEESVVSSESGQKRKKKGRQSQPRKSTQKTPRSRKSLNQLKSVKIEVTDSTSKKAAEAEPEEEKGAATHEEVDFIDTVGLTDAKKNMYNLVDEVKDGPWFTQPEYIRDAEGRRPDDPNYDPSTLEIPDQDYKNMTPGMQRYWEIKSKNFDKIVLYRWGEWFILYYQDAMVSSKILDLCIPPRQLQRMIGFHQSHLKENIEKLVNDGYKVAIAEQTENSKQMNKRIQEGGDDNDLKVVRREVAQIYSIGTFYKGDTTSASIDYDTKYILAFCQDDHKFGFCYYDFSTLKFYLGSFEDDLTLKQFRTLTLQIRPVEAICSSTSMMGKKNQEALMMLKNSHTPPSLTYISMKDIDSEDKISEKLGKYFGQDSSKWPKTIKKVVQDEETKDHMTMTALGMAITYLEQLLQAEVTIPVAEFYTQDEHNRELMKSGNMVIDAQAIEHLELLEIPNRSRFSKEGSFFNFMSQGCSTAFGKRLLKRWVCGPLKDAAKVNERLDAVTDLVNQDMIRDKLQAKLKKLPDLERMLSRIYTYSQRSSVKAIYIDISVITRLDEFYTLLSWLKRLVEILTDVFDKDALKTLRSKRLKALTQFRKADKRNNRKRKVTDEEEEKKEGETIFPDFRPIIEEFEEMIQWKSVGTKKVPEPAPGQDEEFDRANDRVEKIKAQLEDYLEGIRKQLKSRNINYSTGSKRFRYEIEVPEDMAKKMSGDDYTNTSNVKGKKRYQTDELRAVINELEEAEDKFKDALIPFLRTMFGKFYESKELFTRAIQCAAELDCLCALAVISSNTEYGPMTRPVILEDNGDQPYIELRGLRHPCVQEQMAKSSLFSGSAPKKFIPNDVVMGSKLGNGKSPAILLITGPNMGGKSTLLRSTCLASIMAQVGCYIPAEKCELTIVDRVFTRIGASDRILENKSTFFVELEETKTIVEQATKNSLVIMDELGRGTSTFDGYSIAHSVLTYLATKLECRTLFTTHYHMLVEDFRDIPEVVGLYHMKSSYESHQDKLKFLYKFVPGVAPQSFGIQVAKMAGINDKVLEIARTKSLEFNTKLDFLTKKVRDIRATASSE